MDQLFVAIAEKCKTAGFLESVISKAHYASEDRELLFDVLEKILKCMEAGAAWSGKDVAALVKEAGGGGEAAQAKTGSVKAQEVVITLGDSVDKLQEEYLAACQLTEAYMVEVLASEILLLSYAEYNQWIKSNTDKVVSRYHFLGADAAHPIEGLPSFLERSGLPVTCTEGYCMLPKKTVAFYAELTGDRATTCEGICMGCGRTDCPNRMDAAQTKGNRTLDRPLTYGYARIFGL